MEGKGKNQDMINQLCEQVQLIRKIEDESKANKKLIQTSESELKSKSQHLAWSKEDRLRYH